jgi:hypothetical protein
MEVATRTKLTCPECGFVQEVDMPTDACPFLYQCVNCKSTLTPKAGDCCVFCSYTDILCPSKQLETSKLSCCANGNEPIRS